MKVKKKFSDILWDTWCIGSVIGIWPRFIEPNLVSTQRLRLKIRNLPPSLKNLRVLQFSDLHLNKGMTDYFLNKLKRKITELSPDIITFTGDFLCHGHFADEERLRQFLSTVPKAPYGNFAIFGNHDYGEYICVNEEGDYDVGNRDKQGSSIFRGFGRLFKKLHVTGKVTERAKRVETNSTLTSIIHESPFTLIHNDTHTLSIGDTGLNICGLGEHMLGKLQPEAAYRNYNHAYPGIVLVHNPDGLPHLREYPGDIILCGHTHGGQVNLPWMSERFIVRENMQYKHGLYEEDNRLIYINRGVGGILNFRWFCLPEITLLELDCYD